MAQAFDPFARPELISATCRAREIGKLDAIYRGTQYDDRADWWTGQKGARSEEYPVRERKPCIIYKLPKAAVEQVTRFLFGEKRFPTIAVEETDGSDGAYPALNETEAAELTEWVSALIEYGNLQPNMRAIAKKAIACRTAVVVLEVDRGNFRVTLPNPQHCAAQFENDDPTHPVQRLIWAYEFDKEIPDETGRPTTKRHIFRREWDATNVYVWEDVELKHGQEPEWGAPDVQPHGLTFCPVLWIRNEAEHCHSVDGTSLYDGLAEEFEALDMALSRRHQGVIYLGAPQPIEIAEQLDYGPDATGKTAGEDAAFVKTQHGAVRGVARRTGPEYVWTYQGKDVDVKLLETSGKAFEVGTNHVNDIRSRVLETMGVVLTSMADTVSRVSTGAEMSARFLALAHAPLIALVQEYRHSWWPNGLRQLISMMMRMVVDLDLDGQLVMVPGTQAASKILARYYVTDVDGTQWVCPRMKPTWGKFFDLSVSEIKGSAEAAAGANTSGLISRKSAVEFAAPDFGVDNIEQELDELETDAVEGAEQERARLEQEQQALHSIAAGINGENGPADSGGSREEPTPDVGDGSGGTASAPAQKKRRNRKRRPRARSGSDSERGSGDTSER